MIQSARALVDLLRCLGIRDERVLDVIREVPRPSFVPQHLQDSAWENSALPIGAGQTISQPLVVATMTEALQLTGTERVLEIGTGSGYQAAILARLAASVDTIERIEEHRDDAVRRLAELSVENVTCHLADGTLGLPSKAPFDAIIVTAAAPKVPQPLLDQLAVGGRIIVPVGSRDLQQLVRLERREDGTFDTTEIDRVIFVPLVGQHGW